MYDKNYEEYMSTVLGYNINQENTYCNYDYDNFSYDLEKNYPEISFKTDSFDVKVMIDFIDICTAQIKSSEDLKIKSIQETILKNKHTLENFEKRIDEYNGDIPDIIFKKIIRYSNFIPLD